MHLVVHMTANYCVKKVAAAISSSTVIEDDTELEVQVPNGDYEVQDPGYRPIFLSPNSSHLKLKYRRSES
jgi:hypothetical protein